MLKKRARGTLKQQQQKKKYIAKEKKTKKAEHYFHPKSFELHKELRVLDDQL
jgi:hypothetical protein